MIDAARPSSLDAVTLALWLLIQVAAIGVAEAGWRLTARWPDDPSAAAPVLLVSVQVMGLLVLFPRLAAGAMTILVTLAAAAPMTALANKLAGPAATGGWSVLLSLTFLCMALHPWAKFANRRQAETLAVTIGALLGIGVPCLAYLAAEFGDELSLARRIVHIGPANATNYLHFPPPLAFLTILAGICISGILLERFSRRSGTEPALQSTGYPQQYGE